METVVVLMMVLVCFNFILKQTYSATPIVVGMAVVCALFVGFTWPYAIEQSKNQIHQWLANPHLMLNISVILSIEVLIQFSYCLLSVHLLTTGKIKKRTLFFYRVLRWFPGWLIFPVLFSALVAVIFSYPGVSFQLLSWSLGAVILVLVPLATWGLKLLLPEKEVRLELMFLSNALLAVTGVIATVNGQTAVAGSTPINWMSFIGVMGLVLLFGGVGYLHRNLRRK